VWRIHCIEFKKAGGRPEKRKKRGVFSPKRGKLRGRKKSGGGGVGGVKEKSRGEKHREEGKFSPKKCPSPPLNTKTVTRLGSHSILFSAKMEENTLGGEKRDKFPLKRTS